MEDKRRRPAQKQPEKKRRRNSPAAKMAQQLRAERSYEQTQQEQPAQVRRQPPKKRDSRGAATAQQHRDDRKERARLDSLRDKQRRKAKKIRRIRISPDAWKRIIIMGGVIIAAILSMVIFFRVRNVQVDGMDVEGNRYYSDREIIEAAGITMGDNLLTLSRGEIAGNVLAKLSMVKEVRVTRQLPDTVVLHVTEYEVTYGVQDTEGTYYSVTSAGVAVEKLEKSEMSNHVIVEGLSINPPTIGEQITITGEAGKEDEIATQLHVLLEAFKEIEAAGLNKHIGRLQVPSVYQIVVWYGERKDGKFVERFEVRLGGNERLAYKLEYLKAVIAKQKSYASGVIDLTFHDGTEAHVILNN